MKRGDLVTVAAAGDYGKPRPAVVVQSDLLTDADSIILCPLTSSERNAPTFRLTVEATPETGLRERSQVMVEKVRSVRRGRCGPVFGRLDEGSMAALDRLLAFVIGLSEDVS
ncbi:MAG TPA: type II toxin-antitoxin system PemK/MazF family toxin [Beijerinckiaceae bacterium]|jgi:mRNA interferase MazF